MKKSISILFCLFMFPLFLNTSQVNAQGPDISHCAQLEPTAARPACEAKAFDQPVSADGHPPTAAPRYENHGTSPDPKLIMDAATVTQPLHDRIGQLERQLSEATATHESTLNTMKADYESQLSSAQKASNDKELISSNRYRGLKQWLSKATATHESTLNTMKADYESQLSSAQKASNDKELISSNSIRDLEQRLSEATGDTLFNIETMKADYESQLSTAQKASNDKELISSNSIRDLEQRLSEATAQLTASTVRIQELGAHINSLINGERNIKQACESIKQMQPLGLGLGVTNRSICDEKEAP
jgi:hypothetical protein